MINLKINDAVVLAISILIIGCCSGSFHAFGLDFGYGGPSNDGAPFSMCIGKYKIPLNTDIYKTEWKIFPYFNMSGFSKPTESAELINNGEKILLNITFDEAPTIEGGPLESKDIYKFSHMDFQWGDIKIIQGHEIMTAELHLVFYNSRYFNINEALKYSGGIAVMAFSYKDNGFENYNYNELIALQPQVSKANMRAPFLKPLNLMDFTTNNTFYYITYNGSLFKQPCSQDVIWMDFEDNIPLSHTQYEQLGSYFKKGDIKQNPDLDAPIYKRKVESFQQQNPGLGIPAVYSTSRANVHFLIATETCFIILIFVIFK